MLNLMDDVKFRELKCSDASIFNKEGIHINFIAESNKQTIPKIFSSAKVPILIENGTNKLRIQLQDKS